MKFAHMGDCHLGGWRQPELRKLNFDSFQYAIDKCIKEKVEFVLIAGDLFDTPYPSIDTLKETFGEFKKLKDASIPVFLIAGSHDYSVAGKTFLDVLDKAGFSKNVAVYEERSDKIILQPTLYKNFAIYGFPGKKSGLEVDEIERIKLQDAPGLFRILMLHTAIRDAVGTLPIKAVDHTTLPKVDYLALAHLHITYSKEGRVYCGPIFPNNIQELEELKGGSFYIFDNGKIRREEIKIKGVLSLDISLTETINAAENIISSLEKEFVKDKIIILKFSGILEKGKSTDIEFARIEDYLRKRGAFSVLKSTSKLHIAESEIKMDFFDTSNLEHQIIKKFEESHPGKFNEYIPELIKSLQMEKLEDEKSVIFDDRLITESSKVLGI